MANVLVDCEYDVHGSHIDSYVKKMREHPKIKPYYMNTAASIAQWARVRTWVQGEKCQLTTSYLAESFEKHPQK